MRITRLSSKAALSYYNGMGFKDTPDEQDGFGESPL